MGTNPSVSLGYEFFGLDHLKILNDPRYTFDYNLEGQTTAETLFNSSEVQTGEFTYQYDAMGRLDILVEKDGADVEISMIDAPTVTSGQGPMYDVLDRLIGFDLTYKQQSTTPVTYGFSYLDNGLLQTTQGANQNFAFFFTEDDLPAYQVNPTSATTTPAGWWKAGPTVMPRARMTMMMSRLPSGFPPNGSANIPMTTTAESPK